MNLKYRPDIDGLRAVAVIAVILFHLKASFLTGGFIGVDVFFVISGYLITKIIYGDMVRGEFTFKRFYQRRINRILPVFFFVMLATFIAAWVIMLPDEFKLFFKSLKSTLYFGQNYYFADNTGGYWDSAAETMPFLHTWSLAVEEQFYIVLPILLVIAFKFGVRLRGILVMLGLIAVGSFTLAQVSPHFPWLAQQNYYSLITGRAGEMLIGSIAGILAYNRKDAPYPPALSNAFTALGVLGILGSYIFMSGDMLFPSFWAVIPALSAAFVIYFGRADAWVSKALSLWAVVWVGRLSYSLYLWHWPVIVLMKQAFFVEHLSVTQMVMACVIMFALSVFSYRFVETPARHNTRSFKRSVLMFYVLPALSVLALYQANKMTNVLFMVNPERLEKYERQTKFFEQKGSYCHNRPQDVSKCVFGDSQADKRVLLIGDSHAAHFAPYLDEAGKMYGFAAVTLPYDGCFPRTTPYTQGEVRESGLINARCAGVLPLWQAAINAHKGPIILAGRWAAYNALYDMDTHAHMDEFIRDLRGQGRAVIVLAQVPELNAVQHKKCLDLILRGKTCVARDVLSGAEVAINEQIAQSAQKYGAIYFDALSGLDTDTRAAWPIYDGLLAYKDADHMNEWAVRGWSAKALPEQAEFWRKIFK